MLDKKITESLLYPVSRYQDPVSRTNYPKLFNFQKLYIKSKIFAYEDS